MSSSPWGHKELDMTEHEHTHTHTHTHSTTYMFRSFTRYLRQAIKDSLRDCLPTVQREASKPHL